jgi:SAM-dependent MidA family methyltransferase
LSLPALSESENALLEAMREHLRLAIDQAGGALAFDRFMEQALYAPGLGYYVNGRRRFGESGDFITAPEVSPLFGACVANYCASWLERLDQGDVLEFGAGSGRLACDLLHRLDVLDRLPGRYFILELSPDLQAAQRERLERELPHLADRVSWLQTLPGAGFRGVMLGNELLDAMPVHRFRWASDGAWQELYVRQDGPGFADLWREPTSAGLEAALQATWAGLPPPAAGYSSEINQRLGPWLASVAGRLDAGCVLLVDYGYTRSEYYHPERRQGTLLCHYRHRAHADPYLLPGIQDMTANVDFSAVGSAAVAAGLEVIGYTTQAHFLIDNGLDALMARSDLADLKAHLALTQGVKKLTLPTEMGERFKVIALTRGIEAPPRQGFTTRNFTDRL